MQEIKIEHLTKVKDKKILLENIELSLVSNQIYGLVGHNGAGKTTLFKSLLGLIQYTGDIFLDNQKIHEDSFQDVLRKIGFVTPFPDEYDSYSIQELLDETLFYMNIPSSRTVDRLLQEFDLFLSPDMKLADLSLGMKQKLAIVLALVHEPEILLLDEPFNGLDREGIAKLKEKILEFKNKNTLVVISSHSFGELENLISRVILMKAGRVVEVSDVEKWQAKGISNLEEWYALVEGRENDAR